MVEKALGDFSVTYEVNAYSSNVKSMLAQYARLHRNILRIILAVRLRHEITGEWWMALGGLASILFGLSMVARPGAGALAVLTIIGIWSIVAGVSLVFLSFKVKSVGGKLGAIKQKFAPA